MSIADWKEREKEQRRNDIIDAAEKSFFSEGYDNVSMDDIAKKIKLNKATLYLYFPSKESLFYTIVLRGLRLQNAMLREGLKNAATGMDRLNAIGVAVVKFAKKYPDYSGVINYYSSGRFNPGDLEMTDDMAYVPSGATGQKGSRATEPTDSEVVKEIARLRMEMFDAMCSAIKTGQEEGTITRTMEPRKLAILISVLCTSLMNIGPEFKQLLGYCGIDRGQFIAESVAIMGKILANTEEP